MTLRFYDAQGKEVPLSIFFRYDEYDGANYLEGSVENLQRRVEAMGKVIENLVILLIAKNEFKLEDLDFLKIGTGGYHNIETMEVEE